MTGNRPYADACEQNKWPILQVLKEQRSEPQTILEIASGTGQHAAFFARQMPHLTWQTSDLAHNLPGIGAWIAQADCHNLPNPIALDVGDKQWNVGKVDSLFCANAIHIMSWQQVISLFDGIANITAPTAKLIMYGPFNYQHHYTSKSNQQFDAMLKQRDPESGIRNFEDVNQLASKAGFSLLQDYPMPANNRTLAWQKNRGI